MKVTYRVTTGPQYEFVELTEEIGLNTEMSEVRQVYDNLKAAFSAKEGLDDKTIDKFVENQLMGIGNDIEEYNQMSPEQVKWVQRIKRAIKRIEAKQNRDANN